MKPPRLTAGQKKKILIREAHREADSWNAAAVMIQEGAKSLLRTTQEPTEPRSSWTLRRAANALTAAADIASQAVITYDSGKVTSTQRAYVRECLLLVLRCCFVAGVLWCQPAIAQALEPSWAASFAPTGPEPLRGAIGRTIKGISVFSANVCASEAALTLSPAQVLIEAHRRGLVIFDGKALDALLTGIEGRTPAAILLDIAEGVSIGGAVISNTDVFQIREPVRKKLTFGLAAFAGIAHWGHSKLTANRIDPAKVREFALPDAIAIAPRDCWRGSLLGITGPAITFEVRR